MIFSKPVKILLIEDTREDSVLIERTIRDALTNVEFETCGTISMGIRACENMQPDIIILDVNLPDGGLQNLEDTVNKFKSQSAVIILTNLDDFNAVPELINCGADDTISKELIIEDQARFVARLFRGWTLSRNRIVNHKSRKIEVDRELINASKNSFSKTDKIRTREQNRAIEVEQNLQIQMTLNSIEKQVYLTNGTVKDHVEDLEEIKIRHDREDEEHQQAAADRQKMLATLTKIFWLAVTGVFGLAGTWFCHVMGWTH